MATELAIEMTKNEIKSNSKEGTILKNNTICNP